jgi:hypothetical protein
VYRYLFGGFKINVYHHNQQNQNPPRPNQNSREEGTITINPKVKNERKGKTDNLGEYVDYEEVK